jgi:hypothetical protein
MPGEHSHRQFEHFPDEIDRAVSEHNRSVVLDLATIMGLLREQSWRQREHAALSCRRLVEEQSARGLYPAGQAPSLSDDPGHSG